jgi:hypothetical protein
MRSWRVHRDEAWSVRVHDSSCTNTVRRLYSLQMGSGIVLIPRMRVTLVIDSPLSFVGGLMPCVAVWVERCEGASVACAPASVPAVTATHNPAPAQSSR